MKYMLLLYDRGDWFESATSEEFAAAMDEHNAFDAFLRARGATYSGEALQDAKTATSLRSSGNGETVITDGPYVDLKEHLGGFHIIEAADLDDAIEVAKRCPSAGIEIRPVMEISEN